MEIDTEILDTINDTLQNIENVVSSVGSKIENVFSYLGKDGTDSIENIKTKTDDTAKSVDNLDAKLQNHNRTLRELNSQEESTIQRLNEKNEKLTDTNALASSYVDIINKYKDSDADLRGKWEELTGLGSVVVGTFANLSGSVSEFADKNSIGSKSALGTVNSIKTLEKRLKSLEVVGKIPGLGKATKVLSGLASAATGVTAQIETNTSAIVGFENTLLSTLGKFAGFGTQAARIDLTGNIETQLASFVDQNKNVADSLNLSIDEIEGYSMKLLELPGAYGKVIDLTDRGGERLSLLEATVKTARGTTGDYSNALSALTMQFKNFNTTDEKALDMMSKTYDLSQKLGFGFKDVNTVIENTVNKFAVLGDNMLSSVNLVGALAQALKDTGLGIEPTKRIIEEITESIHGMNLAQKAFLSSQTGGAGGLQGAFQVDMLMRQGKVGEVYQKMEQSLRKQFGGNIVTLEEGSRSSEAANQLTKQIQFLTQGPFGAVVKSTEEAYRLLEAFQTAGPGGIDPDVIKKGTEQAFERVMKTSDAIQEKQLNSLTAISNSAKTVEKLLLVNSVKKLRDIRDESGLPAALNALKEESRGTSLANIANVNPPESPIQVLLNEFSDVERIAGLTGTQTVEQATPAGPQTIATATAGIPATVATTAKESLAKKLVTQANPATARTETPGLNGEPESVRALREEINKSRTIAPEAPRAPKVPEIREEALKQRVPGTQALTAPRSTTAQTPEGQLAQANFPTELNIKSEPLKLDITLRDSSGNIIDNYEREMQAKMTAGFARNRVG